MFALSIIGCNIVQYNSNSSNISTTNESNELIYGKYPEPILIAIGKNSEVNKNYKELTKDDLKKVTYLYFSKENGFEDGEKYDFSILLEMTNLTDLDLDIGKNIKLEDYSVLKNLSELKTLEVSNINDFDAKSIAYLTSLENLTIRNSNDLTNIEFLSNMNQLTSLTLDNVPNVHDYQPLKYLPNVNIVDLINCELTEKDIDTIPDMDSLEALSLYNNKIVSLNNFPKVKNLQFLSLSSNPLREINISPDRIPKLKELYLNDTEICDLSKLSGVNHIHAIGLRYTDVKRLSPLKEYKNLTYIDINPNNVEDLDVFKDSSVEIYETEG